MLTASLPPELDDALARVAGRGGGSSRTSEALSARYRDAPESGPVARTGADVAAYATARLPATFAAIRVVLGELAARSPGFEPASLLDLGAGPGTALWAAADVWPGLERATAVEAEPAMAALGRELAQAGPSVVARAAWLDGRLPTAVPDGRADLVTLGYVLAELDEAAQAETVERAWRNAEALVVVEPGTPAGYRRMLAARARLLGAGATLAAPCPHERACPWAGSAEWCHFAVRLPRSSAHRHAKQADLAYEDEKLAYVAVVREGAERTQARVVRHPQLRSGHVRLQLCREDGVHDETVSKRDRERYRRARKASWGESLE
jgi:ribosomal protein RSM22 (predicted rRNA methylase)